MSDNVHGMKCNSCGTVSYPKHMVCPNCRGKRSTDVAIAGAGKVLTFTDVYALAIEYETRYLRLAIVELDDGSPLDPQATYHVLVNNFMYTGGDGYLFEVQDPNGYDTGIHWREPVIEWILVQQTSPERPLETLLDDTRRGMER